MSLGKPWSHAVTGICYREWLFALVGHRRGVGAEAGPSFSGQVLRENLEAVRDWGRSHQQPEAQPVACGSPPQKTARIMMLGQSCRPKRAVRDELLADLPISRTPCEKIRSSRRRHRWTWTRKRYGAGVGKTVFPSHLRGAHPLYGKCAPP